MFKLGNSLTSKNANNILYNGLYAISNGQTLINLSNLTIVDSVAVVVLLIWYRTAKKKGISLKFGVMPNNLYKLIDLYDVTKFLIT